MTLATLIRRSLRFHARSHLGVVLGALIGSTALIGALIVGDSVKGSLEARALRRLGPTHFAMNTGDRFFEANLVQRINTLGADTNHAEVKVSPSSAVALMLNGTVTRPDAASRANHVKVLGVDPGTWPTFAAWAANNSPTNQEPPGLDDRSPPLSPAVLDQWRAGESALINETLARQLNCRAGDEIILRVRKPSALAQDAVITPHDQASVALRLKVGAVLPPAMLADFGLVASQIVPANAFLPLNVLAQKVELAGRANLFVRGQPPQKSELSRAASEPALASLDDKLKRSWELADAQLALRTNDQPQSATGGELVQPSVDLATSRVFLEPAVITAALTPRTGLLNGHVAFETDTTNDLAFCRFVTNGVPILTYLANLIQSGDKATPYSMVTAADAPFVPRDMGNDEILVNQWLADDLALQPGDKLNLVYYAVDSASRLVERTNAFRVRAIVPLKGLYADRTLMPDFPGVARAESTHEWDTGFPLVYKIRDKDEAYWKEYRGTPKAFVTLAAGQAMWASRFGSLTAIRYEVPAGSSPGVYADAVSRNLLANLDPAGLGLRFQPVREQALNAAGQAQDFGQLFLGFSLFLVVAALLLMALLFQFSLEQRVTEIGTFLAIGFTPRQVRRLLLGEGAMLALAGGILGAAGGLVFAKAMLWGLATVWHSAVAGAELSFFVTPITLGIGLCSSTVVAVLTIWLALRRQARQPARELLAGEAAGLRPNRRSRAPWVAAVSGVPALGIVGWMLAAGDTANAGAFFGAGSLLLIFGLALAAAWLAKLERANKSTRLTLGSLGVSGCARRRKRSLATIALLASGCFVIAAIGVFRLDANQDAARRSSGTGGFALIGESTLPIVQDLNSTSGQEFFGLSPKDLNGVTFVPFRLHEGDEASCLNLNRAQKPRLLGVKPEGLAGRFTLASVAKGLDPSRGWALLSSGPTSGEEIPAIADANSIEWALGKSVGDTLDYTDEQGHAFKVRLVGALANSVLQGSLIIDEAQFIKRFPSESGYRLFLLDAPSASVAHVSTTLSRALQDTGLELTPAVERLNAFNAVQNTYLGTFQVLGALGLLLGSAGLGVVVLRNVLERRGELGLLVAVGFRRRQLHWLILTEHSALLALGLGLGVAAAAVAVLPAVWSPATHLPYASLSLTLAAICLNGILWTWLATRAALRGNLLAALRNE